jgi:chromosome segregation ATPase
LKNALGYLKRAFKFRNDFGSPEFDRYLLVKGTRLFGYKTKFEKLQEDHSDLSKNNSELSEKFDRICSEFVSYRKRINQERISFLAKTNKLHTKLQTKNNTISKELEETMALNLKLEADIRQKEKEISQEKAKLEKSYGELERLKKLTWFQKLIGKE